MRIPVITIVILLAAPAFAQNMDGYVDLQASVERQIDQLERTVGGDLPALKQAIALQWLIELYSSLGRTDDVERCYDRILSYYPNDVGTLNAYGRYLMDTAEDYERADSVLHDAYSWARAIDARALDIGTTHQLRAELMRRTGDYDASVRLADRALELLPDERSGAVLRTRARSLVALERFDDAADTWLRLIGLNRATNLEDVNEFKLMVSKSDRYAAGEVDNRIEEAVETARRREVARIELDGGTLVSFPSADGVVLEATMRRADGPGAVLFVHDTGARRSAFTPYGQLLFIDGITSMAVDLRGHGGSRSDSLLSFDTLSPGDRDRLPDDIVAAYRYLQESLGLPEERIAIVSAGESASLVEKAIYRDRIHAPVVHLSPTFPDDDRELATALSFHADHPLLIICGREDMQSRRSLQPFRAGKAREQLTIRLYGDAGHGVDTLRRSTEALEGFQEWLRGVLGSS
jgi:tetratricopeptide (TPR) repeat protein